MGARMMMLRSRSRETLGCDRVFPAEKPLEKARGLAELVGETGVGALGLENDK